MSKLSPWSKRSAAIGSIAFLCAAFFVACSDDNSDIVTPSSGDSSSSVCEDCDDGSSSSAKSSSSSAESSSSSQIGCKTETEDNCEYGELKDDRDGQTYKTVKIGSQWWMAENLNYETPSSHCYNDSAEYCAKYGRLYMWRAAMDSVGRWSTNGKGCGYLYKKTCSPTYPVRGVCPEGWHLPDSTEWSLLVKAVGRLSTVNIKLKSTSGWNDYNGENGNGTDDFGFSALPSGGFKYYDMAFNGEGTYAPFWSSTEESGGGSAVTLYITSDNHDTNVNMLPDNKNFGLSVRCIKD